MRKKVFGLLLLSLLLSCKSQDSKEDFKGTWIEIQKRGNEFLIIDEEGKLKELEFNEIATEIAHDYQAIFPSDFIVGNVILINDIDEFDMLPDN